VLGGELKEGIQGTPVFENFHNQRTSGSRVFKEHQRTNSFHEIISKNR